MHSSKIILDLCSGLGGGSSAFRENGWTVITLDYDPVFRTDIVCDLRSWSPASLGVRPDVIWFSPPCTEFAREFMPWSKTGVDPDLSILLAGLAVIKYFNPDYYLIENVKGAISWFSPVLGSYRVSYDPYYFWGFFPLPGVVNRRVWKRKSSFGSKQEFQRSKIPYNLSLAFFRSVSSQLVLL